MTQTETAKKLGVSQSYISLIFNGRALPSYSLADKWKPLTGWTYYRWRKAGLSTIQNLLNRISEAN